MHIRAYIHEDIFTYLAIVVLTWVRTRSMYWSIWTCKENKLLLLSVSRFNLLVNPREP